MLEIRYFKEINNYNKFYSLSGLLFIFFLIIFRLDLLEDIFFSSTILGVPLLLSLKSWRLSSKNIFLAAAFGAIETFGYLIIGNLLQWEHLVKGVVFTGLGYLLSEFHRLF